MNHIHCTRNQGIFFPKEGKMQLTCYIDAAFGCNEDGKSQTGMVFMLGNSPILLKSVKQKMLGKDSTEAELIGLGDGLTLATSCQDFLIAQGYKPKRLIAMQDNKSVITQASTSTKPMRTLHLKVRRAIVKDMWASEEIDIEYCPTEEMLGDLLTKPKHGKALKYLTNRITHG